MNSFARVFVRSSEVLLLLLPDGGWTMYGYGLATLALVLNYA